MSICYHGATAPIGPGSPHCRGFMITHRHTTVSRTPLDKRSARNRDLYLTTHNTHNRKTSIPRAGLELAISASERPQTHTLDRAVTGIGFSYVHNSFTYWLKMADTLSKEAWLCNSTGINKNVHNPSEKSRLTKYTTSLKMLTIRVSGYRYRGPGFDSRHCQIFLSSSGSGTGSTQPREPPEVN